MRVNIAAARADPFKAHVRPTTSVLQEQETIVSIPVLQVSTRRSRDSYLLVNVLRALLENIALET